MQFQRWSIINADVCLSRWFKPDGPWRLSLDMGCCSQKEIGKVKSTLQFEAGGESHIKSLTLYIPGSLEKEHTLIVGLFLFQRRDQRIIGQRACYYGSRRSKLWVTKTPPSIVIAPRFAPTSNKIIFTGYETGKPSLFDGPQLEEITPLAELKGMSLLRFSMDGTKIVLSMTQNGNTDIFINSLDTGIKKINY